MCMSGIPVHDFEKEVKELLRVLVNSIICKDAHGLFDHEINHAVAAISEAAFRNLCSE